MAARLSGNILDRYLPGPSGDEAVLWYQGPGTANASWLYADQQGSTIAWSDGSGNGQGTQAYDPFGQPQSWSGPRFAYTGQLMLPEARLYDYKARAYDPALGRFLQTDPAGYASDLNPYAYVFNGPLSGIDPTGLATVPCDPTTCAATNYSPNGNQTGAPTCDGVGDCLTGSILEGVTVTAAYNPNAFAYLGPGMINSSVPDNGIDGGGGGGGGGSGSPGRQTATPNKSNNKFLNCVSVTANKLSLSPAAHSLLGNSGVGGFVADAFGNPISGAIDLYQSAGGGSAGGHSFLYNGAETLFAGPAMGFSAAFNGAGGGPIDMLEAAAIVGTEWGTGVGEAKLAYDGLSAGASALTCAIGVTN